MAVLIIGGEYLQFLLLQFITPGILQRDCPWNRLLPCGRIRYPDSQAARYFGF